MDLLNDGEPVTVARLLAHGWVSFGSVVSSQKLFPCISYYIDETSQPSRWTFEDHERSCCSIPPPKTMADLYELERRLLHAPMHADRIPDWHGGLALTPQQQLGTKDCFRACVASILGLPTEHVPAWDDPAHWRDTWYAAARVFCRSYGFDLLKVEWDGDVRHWLGESKCFSIATGRTVNGTLHSVVYCGATLAHDPAPEPAAFMHEPIDIILFVALDPEDIRAD